MTTKTQARFNRVVAKYKPRGWLVKQMENVPGDMAGQVRFDLRVLYCRPVVNVYTLHVYLHEVAHVKLRHGYHRKASYVEEFEAEMWSFAAMVQEGFPVTKRMIRNAKENVYDHVVKSINMEAVKWSITK